ncbi:MAG: Holliday junction branch migration protein RuvA [Clostridiales bacterium]|nr:Holliday junction branch migration protein RuvA [Clostridiales bacterium]
MIGYIKGNVLFADGGVVLLENNGIGYEVICSASVYQKLLAEKKGEVYTYLAVREDGVSLYGFISREEKNMFLKLISVSGVGPKMGITVLSNMNLSDLAVKIATSDVKGLSTIKGLGKKTAERIILELREKITADENGELTLKSAPVQETFEEDNQDAIIALMSLGFTKQECVKAVKQAKESGASTIEQLISYAIKHIK